MTTKKLLLTALMAAWSLLQLSGCSLIGLGLGASADASKPDEDTLHVWQVMRLKRDAEITVSYGSDSSVTGMYLGMDENQTDDYARTYWTWQQNNHEVSFLTLGDTITVRRLSPLRPNTEGTILGFDPEVIRIQVDDNIETIRLDGVRDVVNRSGRVIEGKVLRKWSENGQVPFMSALRIETVAGTQRVPLGTLKEIRTPNSKNHKWTGFACGAVLDIVALTTFRFDFKIMDR